VAAERKEEGCDVVEGGCGRDGNRPRHAEALPPPPPPYSLAPPFSWGPGHLWEMGREEEEGKSPAALSPFLYSRAEYGEPRSSARAFLALEMARSHGRAFVEGKGATDRGL